MPLMVLKICEEPLPATNDFPDVSKKVFETDDVDGINSLSWKYG